jgi:hypothetical protein
MGWWQFQQLGQYPHVLARVYSAEERRDGVLCGVETKAHWPDRQEGPISPPCATHQRRAGSTPMTSFSSYFAIPDLILSCASRRPPLSRDTVTASGQLQGERQPNSAASCPPTLPVIISSNLCPTTISYSLIKY